MSLALTDGLSAGDQAQWLSAILAGVAIIISIACTVYVTRRSAQNNDRLSQDATFMRLHELLVAKDVAAGRRILMERHAAGTLADLHNHPQEWDSVNTSLALYDTLGGYLNYGLVRKEVVKTSWGRPLRGIRPAAESFADLRTHDGERPWPFLWRLFESMEED